MTLWMECSSMSKSTALTATRPPKRLVTLRALKIELITWQFARDGGGGGLLAHGDGRLRRFVKFAAAGGFGQQPFGAQLHHRDERGAVDEQAIVLELAQ